MSVSGTTELSGTVDGGGNGVISVNGLVGALTLTSGTTGTDFAVASSGTTLTLNLPTASASNRGALSSTDWSTFNSKQAAGSYITALTGDVTGAGPGSTATTLAATSNSSLVTLSGLTTAVALVSVGTITTGTWSATTIALNKGGTGQVTKAAAYDALSPMSALGDLPYGGASGTGTRLAGNITTTNKFLTQTGNGSVSAAPSWNAIAAADVPILMPLTGTLATMNATTGSNGQMFWSTTYSAMFQWVVDRWIGIGVPDPRYGFFAYDEFTGTDRIGWLDWNTNAGTITTTAGSATNPGVYLLRQATASAVANIRSDLAWMQFGTMDVYYEALVNIPTLATVGEDFCISVGFNDKSAFDANGACTDGIWFTLNRAVNTTKWIINTSQGGTATNTNTNTVVTAGTFYRLSIIVTAGTSAQFFVNGVSVGTITTNLPTGASQQTGCAFKIDKTAGTGNSDLQLDYFSLRAYFNGARVS